MSLQSRILVALLFTGTFVSGATLSIGSAACAPEQSVTLDVTWSAEGASATDVQFDVEYDSTALSITPTAGKAAGAAAKVIQVSNPQTGRKRILITGLNQNLIGDGQLVVLTVSVKAGASGTQALKPGAAVWSDKAGQSTALPATNGAVDLGGK